MKRIFYFTLVLFISQSCSTESFETINLSKSPKQFADFFECKDSVLLSPKEFTTPISITLTPNGSFLLCDYEKKKVQLLDAKGTFEKDILQDTINGNKIGSPISVAYNGSNGNYYIADNSNRRIHILDSLFHYQKSFIISGSHMTPVFMQSIGKDLYMAGHNINNNKYIHIYSVNGKYKKSFLTSSCPIKDNKYVIGAINYVKFDTLNHCFYGIETLNYTISVYDSACKTVRRVKFSADPPHALNRDTVKTIKHSFEEIRNSFAKPNYIFNVQNRLCVFSEMPSQESDSSDYFNTRRYNMDIFNADFSNNFCGFNIGTYIPVGYNKKSNLFYFLTNHNRANNTYTIKIFKPKF